MEYCQFQNTEENLQQCLDTLTDLREAKVEEELNDELNDEDGGLSRVEAQALLRMISNCREVLEFFGHQIEFPEDIEGGEIVLHDIREHFPELCGF